MKTDRGHGFFRRDIVSIAFLTGSAIQLVGNLEPLLQLSAFAKWLTAHWEDIVELPIRRALEYWGINPPYRLISLLIFNLFPLFVMAGVAISYWMTRPGSNDRPERREVALATYNLLQGRNYNRMTLLLLIAIAAIQFAYAAAQSASMARSVTEKRIHECFVEENKETCKKYLLLKDMAPIKALPKSGRDAIVPQYRQEWDALPVNRVLTSAYLQYAILAVLALSAVSCYHYSSWVAKNFESQLKNLEKRPALHHRLQYALKFPVILGMTYARIIVAGFAVFALSLVADVLPGALQWLKGIV